MGAAFIHLPTDENSVVKLHRECQIPVMDSPPDLSGTVVSEDGEVYSNSDVVAAYDKVTKAFEIATEYAIENNISISIANALHKTNQAALINDSLSQICVALEEFWHGETIDSIDAGMVDVGFENVDWISDKLPSLGYTEMLNRLVQRNLSDEPLNILLGKEVVQVKVLPNQRVSLTCRDGSQYESDAVIVTLPLGVLQAQVVNFIPDLPRIKLEAIQRIGFGTVNKIALEFDRIFWPQDKPRLGITTANAADRGKLTTFDNFLSFGDRPVLVGYAISYYGKESEALSDEELQEVARVRLRSLYGRVMDNVTVVAMSRTRWLADPFSRGAYSYPKLGTQANDWDRAGEPSPPLFFAGDHTQTKEYSTVQTALDTGRRAAKQAMGYIDSKQSNSSKFALPSMCCITFCLSVLLGA